MCRGAREGGLKSGCPGEVGAHAAVGGAVDPRACGGGGGGGGKRRGVIRWEHAGADGGALWKRYTHMHEYNPFEKARGSRNQAQAEPRDHSRNDQHDGSRREVDGESVGLLNASKGVIFGSELGEKTDRCRVIVKLWAAMAKWALKNIHSVRQQDRQWRNAMSQVGSAMALSPSPT
jgi:hypothetical protein